MYIGGRLTSRSDISQKINEEIIDQNFKGEKGLCCFDFDNLGCSAECTFNLVRTRRTDQVQQTIKKKLQTYSYSY